MTATRDIRQTVRFNAPPKAIYRALMNSRKHAAFTGARAKIDPKIGGAFTAWDSHLSGINVELIRDKRIVQAWRTKHWPGGHYSIVTFELKPSKTGTLLVFTQTGIPAKSAEKINEGWKTHYWQLLKKAFAKK